jgi:hypothetical protein
MLASHPSIGFLPETSFLRRYVAEPNSTLDVYLLKEKVLNDERVGRLGACLKNFSFDSLNCSHPEIELYESFFDLTDGKAYCGDKDPRLVEFTTFIAAKWPDSKIIHLYRDPRDVLVSKKKAAWSRRRGLFFHLVAGVAQYRLGTMNRIPDAQLRKVKYEELISKPSEILKSICEWLDIPFNSRMLNFGAAAKKMTSDNEYQWKKETFGPLLVGNSEKWKAELSSFEVTAVETANSQLMNAGNYSRSKMKAISWLPSLALGLLAGLLARLYCIRRKSKNRCLIRKYGSSSNKEG